MKTIAIALLMIVAIATPSLAKKVKAAGQSTRTESTLNSRSVNPIVISRDRALNS